MNHVRLALMATVLAALSGCVAVDAVKPAIEKGAEANDAAVSASLFTICQGASVGAIRREFSSEAKAEVWRSLCNDEIFFSPEVEL